MKRVRFFRIALVIVLGSMGIVVASCAAPTFAPTLEPPHQTTEAPTFEPTQPPTQALPTNAGAPSNEPGTAAPTQIPSEVAPTQVAVPTAELRVLELEWPATLKLGDSDVIRLSLIPSEDGYTAVAEYGEHTIASQDVTVQHPEGFTLKALARLDGAGFEISPGGAQQFSVPTGEAVTWRWSLSPRSPGMQRVSIFLLLRWEPNPGNPGHAAESLVFDRSMEINVISFLGLRKAEAMAFGLIGLAFSAVVGAWAWSGGRKQFARRISILNPNRGLGIESAPEITLKQDETTLMQALFRRYGRLVLESEFMSGYSGARTFLAIPVRPGGGRDAETIIKIGPRQDIEGEYEHYNAFVKDRLPPITARIQSPPVTTKGGSKAAIQYTCISEPGRSPVSLRQALLADPDPALIQRLFDVFGVHWWLQRQPYTFRAAQEYDRLMPPHIVVKPVSGAATVVLHPGLDPAILNVKTGDMVSVLPFARSETRSDGRSLTLFGTETPGRAALRVRWLDGRPPNGSTGRIVALRDALFREYTAGMELLGLPNPLAKVDGWLNEMVSGTSSIIHGDLNLENILVGPGNLLWLIDFAQTREGYPLFDFSHLASELIGHILVGRYADGKDYLTALREGSDPFLGVVEKYAITCQFDPNDPREYHRSLSLACLGALKYQNLSVKAKHFLFLTAAFYGK